MLLLLAVFGQVIGLQRDEHAYARAAQEDGAGQELAFGVRDRGMDLHEADAGAEAIDGLDLDALDGVGRFMEFMAWVGRLESKV